MRFYICAVAFLVLVFGKEYSYLRPGEKQVYNASNSPVYKNELLLNGNTKWLIPENYSLVVMTEERGFVDSKTLTRCKGGSFKGFEHVVPLTSTLKINGSFKMPQVSNGTVVHVELIDSYKTPRHYNTINVNNGTVKFTMEKNETLPTFISSPSEGTYNLPCDSIYDEVVGTLRTRSLSTSTKISIACVIFVATVQILVLLKD